MKVSKFGNIPVFDFFSGPRGFVQESEAGFDGGIELKAADGNAPAHFTPAMSLYEDIDDVLQGNAVQGIAGMRCGGGHDGTIINEE
jgi:hypothetical protein